MSNKEYILSRRAFLRLVVHMRSLLFLHRGRQTAAAESPPSTQPSVYGAGEYGQGAYAGHSIYLPLVNKEGN